MRTRPLNTGEGLLLAEFNHRLGNTLQILSSQLTLCSRATECPVAKPMLSQIDARIRALAAMHRLLATSDNYAILENHCRELCLHLIRALDREDVVPWVQMDDLDLSQDQAAVIAMIVVELVTTVLRYSFQSEQYGTIWVDLRARGPAAEIIVSASRLAPMAPSVPSNIMVRLANALSGHAFMTGSPDFSAGVRFPLNDHVGLSHLIRGRAR